MNNTEEQIFGEKNPILGKQLTADTPMKEWLVNYVGDSFRIELERQKAEMGEEEPSEWDESVTVEMIVETMAKEFPEFLMVVAEENWVRGYHQALTDVEEGEKLYKKKMESLKNNGNANEE